MLLELEGRRKKRFFRVCGIDLPRLEDNDSSIPLKRRKWNISRVF
jgi:hypothetical protein